MRPFDRARGRVLGLPRAVGYYHGPFLMSALRKRWLLLRHPHADIRLAKGVYLGPRFSLYMPDGGTFIAGRGVEFRSGFRAELGPDARVSIGAGSVFTYDVLVQCSTSIDIGERCVFAQGTLLVDGSHRFRDLHTPMLQQGYDFVPLRIEDDAAVMAKCTVIASIGRRAFVGANSVVTRPVPPYTLAGGIPARALEYFGPADESRSS